jgi:hypothetical protein
LFAIKFDTNPNQLQSNSGGGPYSISAHKSNINTQLLSASSLDILAINRNPINFANQNLSDF